MNETTSILTSVRFAEDRLQAMFEERLGRMAPEERERALNRIEEIEVRVSQ